MIVSIIDSDKLETWAQYAEAVRLLNLLQDKVNISVVEGQIKNILLAAVKKFEEQHLNAKLS